jgi:hypothetical protein
VLGDPRRLGASTCHFQQADVLVAAGIERQTLVWVTVVGRRSRPPTGSRTKSRKTEPENGTLPEISRFRYHRPAPVGGAYPATPSGIGLHRWAEPTLRHPSASACADGRRTPHGTIRHARPNRPFAHPAADRPAGPAGRHLHRGSDLPAGGTGVRCRGGSSTSATSSATASIGSHPTGQGPTHRSRIQRGRQTRQGSERNQMELPACQRSLERDRATPSGVEAGLAIDLAAGVHAWQGLEASQ